MQSIQIQSCLELQGQSKHQRENQLIRSGVSILVTSLCMEILSGEVRGSMMQNRLQLSPSTISTTLQYKLIV